LVTASADQSKTFGAPINLPTLVLDLERDHVHTLVDPSVADRFGSERAQPQRAVMELRIITDTDPVPAGFTLLATADPLTPDQRAERQRLIGLLPGVQPNASGAELLQYFVAHPESRAVGDRLGQIPALPVLSV